MYNDVFTYVDAKMALRKKQKGNNHYKLAIRPDHPRWFSSLKFCMWRTIWEMVINTKFWKTGRTMDIHTRCYR